MDVVTWPESFAILARTWTVCGSFEVAKDTISADRVLMCEKWRPVDCRGIWQLSGGVLVVDNETIDTFQKAVVMDGSKEHFVTPHVGDRWSLIIVLHSKAHTLPNSDKLTLKKVGFMLDSPSDPHCPPPEATVSEVERGHFVSRRTSCPWNLSTSVNQGDQWPERILVPRRSKGPGKQPITFANVERCITTLIW